MRSYQLNTLVAIFLLVLGNHAFFQNVMQIYPLSPFNIAFLGSLGLLMSCLLVLLLTLVESRYTTRPLLIVLLLVSSVAAYFMDSYNVVIDTGMIRNALETDSNEAFDLFTPRLAVYFILLGVLPSLLVYRIRLVWPSTGKALLTRAKVILVIIALIGIQVPVFGKTYAAFLREHKALRYYTNPLTWIYSGIKYLSDMRVSEAAVLQPLGRDARITRTGDKRELIILVVGETLRADRLALNGYERDTTPQLARENVISLKDMSSCGTSTAVSVPCLFSGRGQADFDVDTAAEQENLLDVLSHAGVNVLWRDNNAGSKGVAARVPFENFNTPQTNPVCDGECRDEGMLTGLQSYIDSQQSGDIFIVLHQMGNHGPAYYKRYPQAFEQFTPTCKTAQLEECSSTDIGNAYDNAVLYTDDFLARVIALLKQNDSHFQTAMLFISDHGESLGEHGLYLHGLPYLMAPREQTHVAAVLWFGEHFSAIDQRALRAAAEQPASHDNVFHTVLGLLDINTSIYNPELDLARSSGQ